MNREQIIRMAREAGASTEIKHVTVGNGDGIVFTPDELARFASLVRADEREACANLCEDSHQEYEQYTGRPLPLNYTCAAAIRARGQK
jgi:hypothetical protein